MILPIITGIVILSGFGAIIYWSYWVINKIKNFFGYGKFKGSPKKVKQPKVKKEKVDYRTQYDTVTINNQKVMFENSVKHFGKMTYVSSHRSGGKTFLTFIDGYGDTKKFLGEGSYSLNKGQKYTVRAYKVRLSNTDIVGKIYRVA